MNTFETIGNIAVAVLPLTTLCFGVMLGIDVADWLAARASEKKESEKEDEREDKGQ